MLLVGAIYNQTPVTVVVAAYNAAATIRECLNSICTQTYDRISVIVIDDGSVDATSVIAKGYKGRCKDGLDVVAVENRGASAARNLALNRITGGYVFFLDSDDFIDDTTIADLVGVANATGADCVSCRFDRFSGTESVHRDSVDLEEAPYRLVSGHESIVEAILKDDDFGGYCCNKLYRSDSIRTQFREELRYCEDLVFCIENSAVWKSISILDKPLYKYRQNPNSSKAMDYTQDLNTLLDADEIVMQAVAGFDRSLQDYVEYISLKDALNLKGRFVLSGNPRGTLPRNIEKWIENLLPKVLRSTEIDMTEKANIFLTSIFPATMLKLKQFVIAKRYENANKPTIRNERDS